jgi:AcrR family transcriptional regulator
MPYWSASRRCSDVAYHEVMRAPVQLSPDDASALPAATAVTATATVAPAAPRGLRADATRNRVAILCAAREVFAEQGLQAPLEEIARRADVGIATLYRRFPTRERLVAAALVEKISQYAGAARQALANPDPWDGFAELVGRICELQATDRGLAELLSMTLPASEDVEQLRTRAHSDVIELIQRAKAAGRLRPDFAIEDLMLVLIANSAIAQITGPDAPDAWRRFVALVLDAFQHTGGQRLPVPPSAGQMTLAMARLARNRGCGTS